jgi:protein-S-isoprenylcysteine O-methyltransferase Ste14
MDLIPDLRLGWLNGWLLLGLLALTDGILFLVFPKNSVTRLFDRSGWSTWQIIFTVIGKLLTLVTVLMIIFTPLKVGSYVFIIGSVLVIIGLLALVKALNDYRNTPPDQPVTNGIYRISRHPQNFASSLVILGSTIAIGSWLALMIFLGARIFLHANLVAEEDVCLREYGKDYREYMNQVPRYICFK